MNIVEWKYIKKFWNGLHKTAKTLIVFFGLLIFAVTMFIPVPDVIGEFEHVPILMYVLLFGFIFGVGFAVAVGLWFGAKAIVDYFDL